MKELTTIESMSVAGGSILGVVCYGTIGFWVGGISGFCMGFLPAIPGALIGMTVGAYLGTDTQPTVIYVKDSSI